MNGKSRTLAIVALCAVLGSSGIGWAAALSGRVYEGNTGDESNALAGVTVALYGSNNESDDGTGDLPIQTTTTDASGWYSLTVRGAYDYFNIVQTNLSGYTSEGATTVGGSVKSSDWIQYRYEDIFVTPVTMTGNKFWDKKEGQPPANNPPVAQDDSASTSQNTAVDIDVLVNDSDPDSDPLHVNSVTDPPHGTAVNHGSYVTYTPDPGFTGTDTFDYTAGDGNGGTDTATVTVTVEQSGQPPEDTGILDGYKRDADTGAGLENWRIYIDLNTNGRWDPGEPSDLTDGNGYYRIADVEPGTYRVCEEMQMGWEGDEPCVEDVAIVEGVTTSQDFHNRRTQPPGGQVDTFGVCFDVEITLPDGSVHRLSLSGPATAYTQVGPNGEASDTGGNGLDDATTELTDLSLQGIDPVIGTVQMHVHPTTSSVGQIEERANNTPGVLDIAPFTTTGSADSFFDVWFQIDLSAYGTTLFSSQAKRLADVINHLPPGINTYLEVAPTTIDLLDHNGQPTGVRLGPIRSCGSTPPPVEGEYDFGDAPDTYGTLHSSGGPYHDVGEVLMGNSIDAEPDGQPGPLADADNDDGVSFPLGLQVNQFATVVVNVNAPLGVPAAIAGWIDFDQSGTFEDPGERIAGGTYTGAGVPVAWSETFAVPSTAVPGSTYARFRVYRTEPFVDVLPSPAGYGEEGEVEDYRVDIQPGPDVPPAQNLITGLKFNDLDGDGVWEPADGENGMANWTIWLDEDNDGSPDKTVVTNSQGGFDFPGLNQGTYTVGEQQQSGWTQTAPQAPGTFSLTIPGGPQPTAHFLMFGNRRTGSAGSVTIVKKAMPADDTPFDFAAHTPGGFFDILVNKLSDPSSNTWSIADLDRLQKVVETVPAGWTLKDIAVTGDADHGSSVDLANATVYVDYDDGENIVIVFENVKDGFEGVDYGDAPLPYPEASHLLGGPYLGLFGDMPDGETGMQRDTQALGDDNDANGDDENGLLSINLVKTAGAWSTWELKGYFHLSSDAEFGLWIDLNGDGDWDDSNELRAQFGFCGFGPGPQDWFHAMGAFQLPSDAKVGTTYVRLRVYDDCNATISPSGAGGPGEVEDYAVEIKADGPGVPPGGIVHGYKWNDINGDGIWNTLNPIEPPLAGWTIWLDTNHSGIQDAGDMTTQTDAQGHFRFTAVPAGTYTLGEQLQPGWTQTTPGGAGTYTVTVQPGQGSLPQMFGNRQSGGPTADGRICGSKWNDLNGDSLLDAGEPYLSGWTMYLDMNQNGRRDAGEPFQVTDAAGSFEFTGLAAGSYTVAEEMQAGWRQTWPGPAGTHTISVQPGGVQPACVMFGNTTGPVPPPDSLKRFDWGDAPDPTYPTLRASNGAYHVIVPGFHLGASLDGELDGQPAPDALGDDHFDGDDEDGVCFLTPILSGGIAEIEILAPEPGYVDAWIDFDGDGSWSQPGDQILTAEPVAAGSNVRSVAIPASAQVNLPTFARFRLSRTGGLPPQGPAQAGEVEDYHILLGEGGPGVPGEGERAHLKWSQPPLEIDPNVETSPVFCGWNEPARSTLQSGSLRQWRMDADDFRCLGPVPVTGVRWWGGYKAWTQPQPPELQPEAWHIGFWANQVEGLEPDALYLERLVWSVEIPNDRVRREPVGLDEFPGSLPEMCFVYEVRLEPQEWFHQAEFPSNAGIFWISITAVYPTDAPAVNQWGWMTRPHVWRAGAVMPAIMGEWPTPDERLFPGRIYPVENSSLCGQKQAYDLCFELLTDPLWVKWDHPFEEPRAWPYAEDHVSYAVDTGVEVFMGPEVYDDWQAETSDPVVAVAWYGSYAGYRYMPGRCDNPPRPRRPDYFALTMRSSTPGFPTAPGGRVWQHTTSEFDEILVGFDRHPEGDPNEAVYRYTVRLPEEEWFRPSDPNEIYWLTVTAVYRDTTLEAITQPWGWTSRPHVFGSPAQSMAFTPDGLRVDSLSSPDQQPIDMCFSLYTQPAPPEQ